MVEYNQQELKKLSVKLKGEVEKIMFDAGKEFANELEFTISPTAY